MQKGLTKQIMTDWV